MKNLIQTLEKLSKNLYDRGLMRAAFDVNDILYKLLIDFIDKEMQEASDSDIAANLIGLREDGTYQNMNQGYSWEGFSSQYISTK